MTLKAVTNLRVSKMWNLGVVSVTILALVGFCALIGVTYDQTKNIENEGNFSMFDDLKEQINQLKILRLRDQLKFESEIKAFEFHFQNETLKHQELHLASKSEIQSLKSDVQSLTQKILAIEHRKFKSNTLITQNDDSPVGSGEEPESKEGSEVLESARATALSQPTGPSTEGAEIPGENSVTEVTTINQTSRWFPSFDQSYTKSCSEIHDTSLTYSRRRIYPNGWSQPSVVVLCYFEEDGSGWTTIQSRSSGPKEEFYRGWAEYQRGFGSLDGNFWIGLETIHDLTKNGDQELRIDLWDFEGEYAYAQYSNFSVSNSSDFYRLSVSGYSGTAGDSMVLSPVGLKNRARFTTKDVDNDGKLKGNCAQELRGAWWYGHCSYSNLNGLYYEKWETPEPVGSGIVWWHWNHSRRSLWQVEMKIRSRR